MSKIMSALLGRLSRKQIYAIVFGLIAVMSFLFYGLSLKNGFSYDDEGQIINNPYIKSLEYLPEAFTSCIWRAYYPDCKNFTRYYRPFHTLSYLFTYAISPSAAFFHFINILYYIILGVAVFLFVRRIVVNQMLSVFLSLIFIAHPVHSEAVMWISSVPELLFGIFAVFALYLHIRDIRRKEWLVPLFYFFALLSKETALLLPLLLFLYDKLFRTIPLGWDYFKKQWRYVLFLGAYFLMRLQVVGIFPAHQRPDELSIISFLSGFFYSFGAYLAEIFYPIPLLPHMPFLVEKGFADASVLGGLAAFTVFCAVLYAVYRKGLVIPLFGLIFYLIFIFPALIFSAVNLIISERYLLLPSLGIILALGHWLWGLAARYRVPSWLGGMAFLMVLAAAAAAIIPQNKVWANSKALYEHIHAINAQRGFLTDQTYSNLALLYEKEGNIERAKTIYEEIIADPKSASKSKSEAHNNLGTLYYDIGDHASAIPHFARAIEYNSKNVFALLNLAQSHYDLRRYGESLHYAIQAIALRVEYERAWEFLRTAYGEIAALPEPARRAALSDITKDEIWQKWEFTKIETQLSKREMRPEKQYVLSPEFTPRNGFVDARFVVDTRLQGVLDPGMIFTKKDTTIKLFSRSDIRFADSGNTAMLTLSISRADLPAEIYFLLNDFRYYNFPVMIEN